MSNLLHEVEVVLDIFVLQTLDQVLPAHAKLCLIKVHRAVGRVLVVGADGEVIEVVRAVAVSTEQVVRFGPENGCLMFRKLEFTFCPEQ